ncbi:YbhB/YbcL family Raf kinase inhibitor-like protein [Haliangium ochraceum]|uniref:PEBP family protein n=1 Tax=Haliangium ochraceum (strain DSM 14365 / JCM 11303 / SMP-2) TaxID=502025 RepID=D0LUH0_HALO1|nr:YbhB/YbcL family Raf kinase inhibitor-like protein [Haliangium ochraceum]ACY19293.1 PEBP family protein [Haliangium ochraceum DSM 14365]
MKFWSDSFADGDAIPAKYALGKGDPETHFTFSDNLSPHLAWSELPAEVKSLVIVCHDPDAPSQPDDVNQEGKTVPHGLQRNDFYHWVLVDLRPDAGPFAEGAFSQGVTEKGKDGPEGPEGTRQGLNDYTGWFQGNEGMEGQYFGYDGPAPPWNDERIHRYRFSCYALDIERVEVDGAFTGTDVMKAITKHIVDQAAFTGTYHIYPDAKAPDA